MARKRASSDDEYLEKLRGAPRIRHDPDEQPSREDKEPAPWVDLLKFPVKVPRWMTPKRDRDEPPPPG